MGRAPPAVCRDCRAGAGRDTKPRDWTAPCPRQPCAQPVSWRPSEARQLEALGAAREARGECREVPESSQEVGRGIREAEESGERDARCRRVRGVGYVAYAWVGQVGRIEQKLRDRRVEDRVNAANKLCLAGASLSS